MVADGAESGTVIDWVNYDLADELAGVVFSRLYFVVDDPRAARWNLQEFCKKVMAMADGV